MRRRRKPELLAPIGEWKPCVYLIATPFGPAETRGRVYASLGIHQLWSGSPKGRRPPAWNVTHLGSGHAVCLIEAHEVEAFGVATGIAGLTDWDFDAIDGWKNRDPDLMEKVKVFVAAHPRITRCGGSGSDDQAARQIAEARA